MNASGLALLAAIASVVAWGLKAVAIGVAGGLDKSPFEGPLFLVGLIFIVVAFAALGVSAMTGRSVVVKAVAGLVGVLVGFALSMVASVVADAAIPASAGWVEAEAGLWFSALLAVAVTAMWHSRLRSRR